MHLTTVILLLLFITALTNLTVAFVRVPLPLLQIAIGALCDAAGFHVSFDPALFLLLFIPPLLFSDAYRIPKRELTEAGVPVFTLAVGLVIFTTFGVGGFVHWLLPFVPLAAALALAAVLSPTDAVALAGILNGRALPRRFMHVLQGEALLNDASGLVSFNFAVATMAGAHFALGEASLEFAAVAIGGLAVGAAFGWGFFQLDKRVLSRRAEEASIYVVLVLLLPFAAYLTAETLELSGILAAVAAGLTLNMLDPFGGSHGATRRHVFSLWRILEFAFNGLIFLLLGLQLPGILGDGVARAIHAGYSPWALLLLIVLVTVVLLLLRFTWVLLTSLATGDRQTLGLLVPGLFDIIDHHLRGTGSGSASTGRRPLAAGRGGLSAHLDGRQGRRLGRHAAPGQGGRDPTPSGTQRLPTPGGLGRRSRAGRRRPGPRRARRAGPAFVQPPVLGRSARASARRRRRRSGDDPACRPNQLFAISLDHTGPRPGAVGGRRRGLPRSAPHPVRAPVAGPGASRLQAGLSRRHPGPRTPPITRGPSGRG